MQNLYFALLLFVASSCVAFAAHESSGSYSGSSSEPQDDYNSDQWVFCYAYSTSAGAIRFSRIFDGRSTDEDAYARNFARYIRARNIVVGQIKDGNRSKDAVFCSSYDTKAEAEREFRARWRSLSNRLKTNWTPDL